MRPLDFVIRLIPCCAIQPNAATVPGSFYKFRLEQCSPVLRVFDRGDVSIEQVSLVRQILVGALERISQNHLYTSTFLVAVGQSTNAWCTSRPKIDDMSQSCLGDGLFPVNRSLTDELKERFSKINFVAEIFSCKKKKKVSIRCCKWAFAPNAPLKPISWLVVFILLPESVAYTGIFKSLALNKRWLFLASFKMVSTVGFR